MRKLPPLAAIRAFEVAGRLENFSRAADELGMTQAAVSYQIRQLELRLGKSLFVRDKGRVRLSEPGRRLLPAISSGFAGMADAFAALEGEDEDVLALDASVSFGSTWLSARIGRFQLRHPDLAVKLSLSNTLVDFAQGTIDAAIRVGRGGWDGLRSDFLFRQHFTPICSPEFLAANAITCPEDLLRVERHTPNDPMWAGWFAAAGLGEPPPQRRGIALDNQLQEASALVGGFGIALMTPLYWRADLDSGRLVQPFDILYLPGAAQWLVHPEARRGVRKIERFREWVHAELVADRERLPPQIWNRPG
jgi:LysR family transcriptional regulator, glycine cleavage system transcriptional activator